MQIHDEYTKQIQELLSNKGDSLDITNTSWKMLEKSDYLLDSETYIELGSVNDDSLSFTVCSTTIDFEDKIVLIGKDIKKLKGKVSNFSKVVFVNIKGEDNQNEMYKNIREVERIKHSLNYEGTMLRASSLESRECFRISKSAYKNKLNFSILGSELIKKFKEYDFIKSVQVYYIVDDKETISTLSQYPKKINLLTQALNHIFDDIVLDCESCAIKEICDEVDGMRDSHKQMYKM